MLNWYFRSKIEGRHKNIKGKIKMCIYVVIIMMCNKRRVRYILRFLAEKIPSQLNSITQTLSKKIVFMENKILGSIYYYILTFSLYGLKLIWIN